MTIRNLALIAILALTACGPSDKPSKVAQIAAQEPNVEAPAPAGPPAPPPQPAGDPAAAAFEARYTPTYNQCLASGDAAKGVTAAMANCIGAELAVQDKALNMAYARVMHRLPPERTLAVRDEQRQWIKDRDAKCKAAASDGGTIDQITGPSCLLDETILRTMELERITPA